MSRERMVTRTVLVQKVEVICMDVVHVDTQIKELELSGSYKDTNDILKALKKVYETDTYKVVAVQSVKEEEILYGMPEVEFIKLAKILPPRSTKVDE